MEAGPWKAGFMKIASPACGFRLEPLNLEKIPQRLPFHIRVLGTLGVMDLGLPD